MAKKSRMSVNYSSMGSLISSVELRNDGATTSNAAFIFELLSIIQFAVRFSFRALTDGTLERFGWIV